MSDDRNAVLANTAAIEKLEDELNRCAHYLNEALTIIQAAEMRELKLIIALRYYAAKSNTPEARALDKALSELGVELAR